MNKPNKAPNNKEFPLTRETWRYIKQRQKELDNAFLSKAKWLPNDNARLSALLIERGELINEFPETFKWWKHKDDDRARIIDEYIDLLHFLAGMEDLVPASVIQRSCSKSKPINGAVGAATISSSTCSTIRRIANIRYRALPGSCASYAYHGSPRLY